MASLSKPRLEKLRQTLAAYADRKDVPGLVAFVSSGDDAFVEAFGTMSLAHPAPMQRDAMFRIASLTKLVTAAAAMILIEDCEMRLDDSIEPWIPELANRRVLKSLASQIDDTVPAQRPITVRDVLTYRMGFGSIMAMPDTYPIQKFIREYHIGGDGPMLPTDYPATDEWLRRLGSLPLIAQPGERWMYQVSGDVLGALISRISGKALGAFMRERIFDPLGMYDTGFRVPREKASRLPALYYFDRNNQALETFDDEANSAFIEEPAFESGGGGLVSTIDDFFTFSRMMLNEGRHGRQQILSPATVALMTSDQLTPEQRSGSEIFFGDFSSWGLGFAVDIARREIFHTPGRYGWTGGFGTTAYIDPAKQTIGILFTQRMMDSPEPPRIFTDFWTLAYAAIDSAH